MSNLIDLEAYRRAIISESLETTEEMMTLYRDKDLELFQAWLDVHKAGLVYLGYKGEKLEQELAKWTLPGKKAD